MSQIYEERATTLFTSSRSGSSIIARLLSRYLIQPLVAMHQARKTYRELMALDDRQLADIGLKRCEIEMALTGRAGASGSPKISMDPVNANALSSRAA